MNAVAIPFFVLAGFLLAVLVQPNRRQFGAAQATAVLSIGCVGMFIAARGAMGGHVPVELWWVSTLIAVLVLGLAPYSSAIVLAAYALAVSAITAVVITVVFVPQTSVWLPVTTIVIGTAPVLFAGVAGSVFSYTTVSRLRRLAEVPGHQAEPSHSFADATHRSEAATISNISARVAPFLEAIATSGTVTDADRAHATNLAATLRAELVATAERSWLDEVARESGLVVVDPARLADDMNEAQRGALRGLIVAAMESPTVDPDSLFIELRGQADGATAVALSLDVDLPEGRRLLLLAPYYLTLKPTVDNLAWDDGRSLKLTFQVPAGAREFPTDPRP
jgi:hypothetical protein